MVFNVHAGHNAAGRIGSGAGGVFDESTEARNVKNVVIRLLQEQGHTCYDCTVDDAPSVSANLVQIVDKCNSHKVDLDISIHFNASDGIGHGTEVLVYSSASASNNSAQSIVNSIAGLGFANRGVKIRNGLYVLRRTNSPALLIECCFCDSQVDAGIYNAESMGTAIVNGILGSNIPVNYSTPAEIKPAVQAQPDQPVDWDAIKKFLVACGQTEAVKFTGHSIGIDGIYGPETKRMKVRVLQTAMNKDYHEGYVNKSLKEALVVDGIWGDKTEAALANHYIEKGEKQYMVTAMEIIALIHGNNPNGVEYPGKYGDGLASAYNTNRLDREAIKFLTLI